MPVDIDLRCSLVLFLALSLGVGCGLIALPAFDPVLALNPGQPWSLALAFAAHGLLAWASTEMIRRQLPSRTTPVWSDAAGRWAQALALAAAFAWWTARLWSVSAPDARALVWLESLPLWLFPAGLLRFPSVSGRRPQIDVGGLKALQHLRHDGRLIHQIDMGGGGHMAFFGVGQHRIAGREHDIVAVAEEA